MKKMLVLENWKSWTKALKVYKALYAGQIKRIQDLISEITEKSVSIQALETRNRDAVTAYFSREKQALGQGRRNSKAAYGYYQNLNKAIQEDASIMDMKK